ncbi:MAG: 16S rRNA (adenine(1518)-N(6)/adenine(1519)-N(6))-dimethyltransferase RsmA [Gammaproteobacteria bacterium]|nr:16S rRNA (adenine(1518)-N(6)/adenine(1519)-N(6))-dimethyltransferase RsmA [Gammaproteobacteria bacterium]
MIQHIARKRFGQNFLTDEAIIDRIVRSINPQAGDKLVEIGPGLGALTRPLLSIAGKMDAIELDRDIIPKLRLNVGIDSPLTIHNYDVLKFDFNQLIEDDRQLRIIGNLPYNISTPIIFHLTNFTNIIQDMYFMLQKEVVERLAAAPGTSDYSRLSVMVQYYFKVAALFIVPPESFEPQPKVDSAIVRLEPYKEKPFIATSEKAFSQLVALAFSQRRKTLRNVLKNHCTQEQLESAGINPGQRAQELRLEQFVQLSNILQSTESTKI